MSALSSVTQVSAGYTPLTTSKSTSVSESVSCPPSADTVVSISDAAKTLQTLPSDSVYDPTNPLAPGGPVDPSQAREWVEFIPASDVEGTKQHIRESFLSVGVYVDDAYVNAFYDAIIDINTPGGIIPPNMELPDPPSWWAGYRPIKDSTD